MSPPTFAVLVEYGDPLTREGYLNINHVDEDDLDAEQESELPISGVDDRGVSRRGCSNEIADRLRQLSEVKNPSLSRS